MFGRLREVSRECEGSLRGKEETETESLGRSEGGGREGGRISAIGGDGHILCLRKYL